MKSAIAWSTDSNNSVLGPRYHDSQIVHFAYSQTRRLLSFVMQHGSSDYTQCDVSGIIQLSVTELWEGTIISDVFVQKASLITENLPDSAWKGLFAKRYHNASEAKKDVLRIVQKQAGAMLIEIQSSYGGDIVALCEGLAFWKLEVAPGMGKIDLDPTMG